jgi:hypothetical protein
MTKKHIRILVLLSASLLLATRFIVRQQADVDDHASTVVPTAAPDPLPAQALTAVAPAPVSTNLAAIPAPPHLVTVGRFSDDIERETFAAHQRKVSISQKAKAVAWARRNAFPERGETDGRTFELAAWINGRPYVRTTCNRNAAISAGTDKVRDHSFPNNLQGDGYVMGVWDAGSVRDTHQELRNRVTKMDTAPVHSHSSHVGGTMTAAGVQVGARGMAPAAHLDSYDWNEDYAEMALTAMASPTETNRIPISNHSYGFQAGWFGSTWYGTWGNLEADGFGQYDTFAALADQVCYDAPYFLPFKAAGNDRNDNSPSTGSTFSYFTNGVTQTKTYDPATDPPDDDWDQGGFDTISHDATAKNIMTVGAVNDAVSGTNRFLTGASMTSFSSWGPVDDGRIKPDIVANGATLYSTSSFSDGAYSTLSGTSMAAPSAAGSALLVVQHFARTFPGQAILSSMLKALLIHTTDDLGRPGPDYTYGWGLIDMQAAVLQINSHAYDTNAMRLVQGHLTAATPTNQFSFIWDMSSPIRATLCWTDPPGEAQTGLDNRQSVLINDLDLRIVHANGTLYEPFVLDADIPIADATTGDNDVDTVEQVYIAAPTLAGRYDVSIGVDGVVVQAGQTFSLVLSGAGILPQIQHTPLENTTNSTIAYIVEAQIDSEMGVNPSSAELSWWTTADGTNLMQNVAMLPIVDNIYRTKIPAHPVGTEINYFISAADVNGLTIVQPQDAPTNAYAFSVVPPLPLSVSGSPGYIGVVDPDYGTAYFPSGITVTATAMLFSPASNSVRSICVGWVGSGSVPTQGTERTTSFVHDEASSIDWQWAPAYQLTERSYPTGQIDKVSWWQEQTTAVTTVATEHIQIGDTNYAFIGWTVNGARHPSSTNQASNPATISAMDGPKVAIAVYVDASLDGDGDGLPDWWEHWHAGSTAMQANVDDDDDGFSNRSEYLDDTDPNDIDSRPTPPAIAHTPLPNPQNTPADWAVSADVSDAAGVSRVRLEWQRNSDAWQHIDMVTENGLSYSNAIAAPGVTGDQFHYRILATDTAGMQSINGTYLFDVRYPVLTLNTNALGIVKLPIDSIERRLASIANDGHASLDWTLDLTPSGFSDDVERGQNGWNHGGINDVWHLSSVRAFSGSNSWYFGSDSTHIYPSSANAWLQTPEIFVPTNGILSFMHWLDTEDLNDPLTAWDGGVVEISTNGGINFSSIPPVGGYPYVIFGHPASPFPGGTPVLAGDGDWEQVTFDLSAYGDQFVHIRMRFGSDGFVVEEGWFIDDIRVTPFGGEYGEWLTIDPIDGSVAVSASQTLLLWFDTQALTYGEQREGILRLLSNDPLNPEQLLHVAICNTSRRIDVFTSGSGTVNPPGPLVIQAGDSLNFTIEAAQFSHIANIITDNTSFTNGLNISQTNFHWAAINVAATGSLHAVFALNLVTNSLTEAWLAGHGFTNDAFIVEAQRDHDGDGASAWHEFVAGTQPTNAMHVLNLTVSQTNTAERTLHFTWPSAVDRTYDLLAAPDLSSLFQIMHADIQATPPMNVYTTSVQVLSNRVFRLRATLQE